MNEHKHPESVIIDSGTRVVYCTKCSRVVGYYDGRQEFREL